MNSFQPVMKIQSGFFAKAVCHCLRNVMPDHWPIACAAKLNLAHTNSLYIGGANAGTVHVVVPK
jgi:hypothetical protein